MKDSLFIDDTIFQHAKTSSWYNESSIFDWDRENPEKYREVVLTDLEKTHLYEDKIKYGWLIEPPHFDNTQYILAQKKQEEFEKIFTYDRRLVESSNKFEYLPYGASWIHETDRKIYSKTKTVCIISSFKKVTISHNFRHKIIEKLKGVDVYGNGYNPIENKIDVLRDYMFSIAVENQKMDYFFSEKLIDCFLTGTIPIYYGCPSISEFFNINGILSFDNIPELITLIEKLDESFYHQKLDIVEENFELAKKYVLADDIIYKKIKNKNLMNGKNLQK